MTKIVNINYAISGIIGLGIISWTTVLYLKGIPAPYSLEALKEVPTAAGWATPIAIFFMKWGWKFRIFHGWLVLVPNLNGTWKGEMRTSWIDPTTGKNPGPIKAFLVIKQTLTDIHCTLMTKESKSWSRATAIQMAPDGEISILEFTYSNSPRVSVQNRSNAHDGACSLELINTPTKKMKGKYWTDRNTKGELDFKFSSKDFREAFE